MDDSTRLRYLRIALVVIGVSFLFGITLLNRIWPSGWNWGTSPSHYLYMIVGAYAVLGIFLIRAAKDPLANRGLIWFTVWSSVVHALIMGVQSFEDPAERGHLVGDVPVLLLFAAVLALLMPRHEPRVA